MIYFQIIIVVILGIILESIPDTYIKNNLKKLIYIIACLTLFLLIAALRNIYWATSLHMDATSYAYIFRKDSLMSWNSLYTAFIDRYFNHIGDFDIGYDLLGKLIGRYTDNYNYFSLIIDLLFFIPIGILLYKYTTKIRQIMLALIFYIALIQVHMISGARQMFAIGLDVVAVMYSINNKKIKAIAFFLLGITIHFSSLLAAIPLLLIFLDVKSRLLKRIHFITLCAFPVVLLFPNQIIIFLGNAVGMEKYAQYGMEAIQGGANTFIIMIELLSLFCYFAFSEKYLEDNKAIRNLYIMVPLFTIFAPLVHSNGSMIRISLFYHIYLMILLPIGLELAVTKKSQMITYFIVTICLIALIIKGGVMDYRFMWQPF